MPVRDPKKNNMINIFPEFQPLRIKYKDIFSMSDYYDSLHEYLDEHGWEPHDGSIEQWETYYAERVDKSGAKEIWIQWRVRKQAPGSEMITNCVDLDFHCVALQSTEVVRDGQKMKVNKGECELVIRAFVELAYLNQLKDNFLFKQIRGLFQKRMYRQNIEQRKKELYQEMYALQNFIKQWLKLKRYLPYEETKTFFPSKAWPSHLQEG